MSKVKKKNTKKLVEGVDYVVHGPASKKHEMILSSDAQVLVVGGAMGGGKTYLSQLIALRYIDCPHAEIVTFRRTMEEIKGQGGCWDTACGIFDTLHPKFKPSATPSRLTFRFPSGAREVFKGIEHEKDVKKNQGLQFTLAIFDEGTLFEWSMIEYMFQRMRSKSKYKSRIVITCNPDPDHKIAELIDWWLNEEGYPDPDKEGVIRFFVRRNGEFLWGDSREELGTRLEIPTEDWDTKILSMSFIGCTIYDNPPMLANNKEYLAFLEGMDEVSKARNLHGNWYIRPQGSSLWKREWVRGEDGARVKSIADIPDGLTWYRGVDKGYSIPSEKNRAADPTVISPKIAKDTNGMFWIVGDYHPEVCDVTQRAEKEQYKILGQVWQLSGERDQTILKQMIHDGDDTKLVLTRDLGAGLSDHQYTCSLMIENGINVVEDLSPRNTPNKKLKDFTPFSSACQLGLVYICEDTFNKGTLDFFYKQLEIFEPSRKSTSAYHDDLPDSMSLAFSAAATQRSIRTPIRNQRREYSRASSAIGRNESQLRMPDRSSLPDITRR